MTDHKPAATVIWVPVETKCCPVCHGTGWQDVYLRLICISCMGRGYQVYYEQRIISEGQ